MVASGHGDERGDGGVVVIRAVRGGVGRTGGHREPSTDQVLLHQRGEDPIVGEHPDAGLRPLLPHHGEGVVVVAHPKRPAEADEVAPPEVHADHRGIPGAGRRPPGPHAQVVDHPGPHLVEAGVEVLRELEVPLEVAGGLEPLERRVVRAVVRGLEEPRRRTPELAGSGPQASGGQRRQGGVAERVHAAPVQLGGRGHLAGVADALLQLGAAPGRLEAQRCAEAVGQRPADGELEQLVAELAGQPDDDGRPGPVAHV